MGPKESALQYFQLFIKINLLKMKYANLSFKGNFKENFIFSEFLKIIVEWVFMYFLWIFCIKVETTSVQHFKV